MYFVQFNVYSEHTGYFFLQVWNHSVHIVWLKFMFITEA